MNIRVTRYFSGVRSLTASYLRRFFRDKVAIFFTFLFPVMFLLVFGALNSGSQGVSFDIALINHADTPFAQQFVDQIKQTKALKIHDQVTSLVDAKDRMGRGEIDSILELPENFGQANAQNIPAGNIVVYFEQGSPQTGQTLAALMQGALDHINQELTHSTPPLKVEQRSTATANLSSFDYVFSGLLGFTIMSMSIFGMANGFPAEKKTGAFRRLRAAPIGASQLIFANGLSYLVTGLLSIAAMFVVALTVFHFSMRGDYFNFIVFSLVGIITLFGFGLAIGGWAKNENQSAPLSNLVAFPLMFLSGVFFPRFLMPDWLQNLTGYLPLSPIVDGLRLILTEGKTLLDLGPQLAVLGVWAVVIYFVAIKVFRWE